MSLQQGDLRVLVAGLVNGGRPVGLRVLVAGFLNGGKLEGIHVYTNLLEASCTQHSILENVRDYWVETSLHTTGTCPSYSFANSCSLLF